MNKEELVAEISKKAKVTQKEANEVLSALIETVEKTVSKGKKVTLVGFGTWEPRKRAARNGRNPQTGKEIKILKLVKLSKFLLRQFLYLLLVRNSKKLLTASN